MNEQTNLTDLIGQLPHEAIEEILGKETYVHSSPKSNRKSILEHGLGVSGNRVITQGIYTFDVSGAEEMFDPKVYDYYHIKLKPGARILFTDSDRPMDYVLGNFDSPFKKDWIRIVEEIGVSMHDIASMFGGEGWFDWKEKFHRGVEKHLVEKGYAGIQEGGQITITDLTQIESITLEGKPVAVNTEKKFSK